MSFFGANYLKCSNNFAVDCICWDICWIEAPVVIINNYWFLSRSLTSCISNTPDRIKFGPQLVNIENQYVRFGPENQPFDGFKITTTCHAITTALDVFFFPNSKCHARRTVRLFSLNFLTTNNHSSEVSDSILHIL